MPGHDARQGAHGERLTFVSPALLRSSWGAVARLDPRGAMASCAMSVLEEVGEERSHVAAIH